MADRFISDETLMGYLLDALTDDEVLAVENELALNSHLRLRLKSMREMLFPLAEDNDLYEPPSGLSDRVLGAMDDVVDTAADFETNRVEQSQLPVLSASERDKGNSKAPCGWSDLFVVLSAAIVGLCILSPAILKLQEGARTARCAGQLHEIGQMIRDYAFYRPKHVVPEVDATGPLAFAGVYAIRLSDAGLLDDRSMLWCPNNQPSDQLTFSLGSGPAPKIAELLTMPQSRQEMWQRIAGGSYAYNLGIMIDRQHATPEMQNRPSFAILADAPLRESTDKKVWTVHFGSSSNVLFEDGHIQLMRFDEHLDLLDHPYWNHQGENRAGVDSNDSVLGRSGRNPLDLPRNHR
ncbi:MAG: hypothetical protein NTW52_04465 [Planctomycetota bacterium]|nr:hypothetical protein [Planctomycetota bacterium]